VSDSEEIVNRVEQELEKQLKTLPRKEIAEKALNNSKAIVVNDAISNTSTFIVPLTARSFYLLSCRHYVDGSPLLLHVLILGNHLRPSDSR